MARIKYYDSISGTWKYAGANPSIDTTEFVKSVNGVVPDASGNIDIEIPEIDVDSLVAKPDLTQNDETAPDYVKGRTHWVEDKGIVETVMVSEYTFKSYPAGGVGVEYIPIPSRMVDGATYIVTLNGTIYECVSRIRGGVVVIGNETVYPGVSREEGDGEPFFIEYVSGNQATLYVDNTNNNTISIVERKQEFVYHTISEKFLPESVKIQADWNQDDDAAPDYIKNRPFYSSLGYEVWCENQVYDFSSANSWPYGDGRPAYAMAINFYPWCGGDGVIKENIVSVVFDDVVYEGYATRSGKNSIFESSPYFRIGEYGFDGQYSTDDIPFCIFINEDDYSQGYIVAADQGTHSVSVVYHPRYFETLSTDYLERRCWVLSFNDVGEKANCEYADIKSHIDSRASVIAYDREGRLYYPHDGYCWDNDGEALIFRANIDGEVRYMHVYPDKHIEYSTEKRLILTSSTTGSAKKFAITVTDDGVISATEVI